MGIFLGIAMVGGAMVGLVITLILSSIAFVIMQNVNRRIDAGSFFKTMFAIILSLLVLGMSFYPYRSAKPGSDYDIIVNNFFIGALGYSVSIGVAALFAAIVAFSCPLSLCPKKLVTEIVPKSNSINVISKILIVCSSLGMLGSGQELIMAPHAFENSLAPFLASLLLFILSLGLLNRKNWARRSLQTFMALVILLILTGFALQFPQMIKRYNTSIEMILFMSSLWIIVVFFPALIIFVLNSKEVKSEFVVGACLPQIDSKS